MDNYIYLITKHPKCKLSMSSWRRKVINHLYKFYDVKRITNHDFLKFVPGPHSHFVGIKNLTQYIFVKDRTKHSDIVLSDLANQIAQRGITKRMPFEKVIGIVTHLVANLYDLSYTQEAKHHLKLSKQLRKLAKTMTSDKDHGWEIKELKKATLILGSTGIEKWKS